MSQPAGGHRSNLGSESIDSELPPAREARGWMVWAVRAPLLLLASFFWFIGLSLAIIQFSGKPFWEGVVIGSALCLLGCVPLVAVFETNSIKPSPSRWRTRAR